MKTITRLSLGAMLLTSSLLVDAGCAGADDLNAVEGAGGSESPQDDAWQEVGNGTAAITATTGLIPLTELGTGSYRGFPGGLYSGGANAPPTAHRNAAVSRAKAIVPRNGAGVPTTNGNYVLLSIGMSNASLEFCAAGNQCTAGSFMGRAAADPTVNHTTLRIVNGATGGMSAPYWDSAADPAYDAIRDQRLGPQGLTERQVAVVWLKSANVGPNTSLPAGNADAYALEVTLGDTVRALRTRYPNLKLVFLSSRIYGGWMVASSWEPYAYEGGFAQKWLVSAQIAQKQGGGTPDLRAGDLDYNTVSPWLGWGPYLWADGTNPRADGLTWVQTDFQSDGLHPAPTAVAKVADLLLAFFQTQPMTKCWFLVAGTCP